LSNFQIIDLCKKLKLKNFKGVFMRDELSKDRKSTQNECLILNTDHSSGSGTHWVSLFIKNGAAYYFDSYGNEPPKEIERYCGGSNDRSYSTFQIQQNDLNSVMCGHYCVYMLYRLNNGHKFYDVLDELYRYDT
jgi:hypothetical protein